MLPPIDSNARLFIVAATIAPRMYCIMSVTVGEHAGELVCHSKFVSGSSMEGRLVAFLDLSVTFSVATSRSTRR